MMDLRSYKTVVLFFARYYHSSKNFDAVIKTANKYTYANSITVEMMLSDLGVIQTSIKGVEYDEDRLNKLLDYIIDE